MLTKGILYCKLFLANSQFGMFDNDLMPASQSLFSQFQCHHYM